uniref:DDE Tnp4 domain-containing protein n=1 Tax=Anopheles epiroticus TaxID=199890 RepID=A0A182PGU3_9DIPT
MCDEDLRLALRMSDEDFNYLLNEIKEKITRQDTFMKESFTAKERLLVTLRFLATGDSFLALSNYSDISASSIRNIIPEVCDSLIKALKHYVKFPSSEDEWLQVSRQFEERWQFPHAIGVIEARHVKIRKPANGGSEYFNYKSFCSIVLLAIVDASSNFMYVCIGGKGSLPDGGMSRNASFHAKFEQDELNVPPPTALNDRYTCKIPYMLLGDKSFVFTEYCIRPFGGHHSPDSVESKFNARLSTARTPAKIVFDGLCRRFKILGSIINLHPDKAGIVVMATVYLYNFLRRDKTFGEIVADAKGVPDSSYILPRIENKPLKPSSQMINIRLQMANCMAGESND